MSTVHYNAILTLKRTNIWLVYYQGLLLGQLTLQSERSKMSLSSATSIISYKKNNVSNSQYY